VLCREQTSYTCRNGVLLPINSVDLLQIEEEADRHQEYSMIKHFVKFLYRKTFFVISGLFIVIGAVVAFPPITTTHAATVSCPPQIQEGATNTAAVNQLHSALQNHYNSGDLKNGEPDNFTATSSGAFEGGFGSQTTSAVIDYQTQHGLGVDGIVGPQTWGSLLGVTCSTSSSSSSSSSTNSSSSSSGGGCSPSGQFVQACISVDRSVEIVPDAYINIAGCNKTMELIEDGNVLKKYSDPSGTCGNPGYWQPLNTVPATAGHAWWTYVEVNYNGVTYGATSPKQFT
jgi:hypothetical protein